MAVKFLLNDWELLWPSYIEQAVVVYGCQNNTETEIMKLKEKITKTKDQLAQLYPKYDTERRNEEQAASQWVDTIYLLMKLLHIPFLLRVLRLFSFILSFTSMLFSALRPSLFWGTEPPQIIPVIDRTDFIGAVSVLFSMCKLGGGELSWWPSGEGSEKRLFLNFAAGNCASWCAFHTVLHSQLA